MTVLLLVSLSSVAAREMFHFVLVVVAAVGFVVVANDVLEPCNAEPIPSWRWGGYRLPYQQIPSAPCKAGSPLSKTSEAYLVQSFFAPDAASPAAFSPPPAFACLPLLLQRASSSLIPLLLAIAEAVQVTVP